MKSNCIEFVIDESLVAEYSKHYFAEHPRAKKAPIAGPNHPSINQWMVLQRQAMNTLKQKWKDFSAWIVRKYGCEDMGIECCTIEVATYYGRRIRHDADNYVPKFILDGFVEAGFLVDDDDQHITALTLKCQYDKEWPRTEIKIFIEQKENKE